MRSRTVELSLFHESTTGPSTSIPTYLNANVERDEAFTGAVQSVLTSQSPRRRLQLRVRFREDSTPLKPSLDYKITITIAGKDQSYYIPASHATNGREYIFRTFWQTTSQGDGKSKFEPMRSGLRGPSQAGKSHIFLPIQMDKSELINVGPMTRERNDTFWQISPESNECCVAVCISRGTFKPHRANNKNGYDFVNLPTDPPERDRYHSPLYSLVYVNHHKLTRTCRAKDTGIPKVIKDSWFQPHPRSKIEAFQFLKVNRIELANKKPLNDPEILTREQVKSLLGSTYAGIAEDTYIVNPTPMAKVSREVKREWSFEDDEEEKKKKPALPTTKRKQLRQDFQPKWNLSYTTSIPNCKSRKPSFPTAAKLSSSCFSKWQDFDDDEDDEEQLPVKQEPVESSEPAPKCGSDIPKAHPTEVEDEQMLQLQLEENLIRQEIRRRQLRKQDEL